MKRKYGGQRRSNRKRYKRSSGGPRSRGISATGMLARRAGAYKGSKRLRTLARNINQINSVCYSQNQDFSIVQSTSTTAAKYLMFPCETNPMDFLTGQQAYQANNHKWSQNIRWSLFLECTSLAQRVEVLVLRNRKTLPNGPAAIGDHADVLSDLSKPFCFDPGLRADFQIVKTYSFCGNNNQHKAISGFMKIRRRKYDDWRDATDTTAYYPRGSYFILLRHCNMSDSTSHAAVRGTFTTGNFNYSSSFS